MRTADEIAAQIWCRPEAAHIPMNVTLAQLFSEEIMQTQQQIITDYLHKGIPRPDGRCASCGDRVTTGVANQGQLVDLSGYGYCTETTPLQRLEIDLEHAQDRVRAIERQIAAIKRSEAS